MLIRCLHQLLSKCLCKPKIVPHYIWIQNIKKIAYTDHTHFQSQTPQLCFLFCFLPASHWFYYCPSNLSCMFKSQNWVEYFLLSFSQHYGETSFLIKPRMGMYVEILRSVNHLTFHCLRLQLVISDWKSTKFVKICIPLHSGFL